MPRRRRAHGAARVPAARACGRGDRPSALRILVIAVGLLFGQTTAFLHLLMVPHAPCEHGQLVEIHAAQRAAAPDPTEKQARVSAATPGDVEHEHCTEIARPHRLDDPRLAVGEASLLCIEPSFSLGEHAEARPVELLSLAPKSSPPSA